MDSVLKKPLGEVFGAIGWEDNDKNYINTLMIDKINILKKTGNVEIHASSDVFVPLARLNSIEKKLSDYLKNETVNLKMKYSIEKSLENILNEHVDDIVDLVNREMPASIGLLHNSHFMVNQDEVKIQLRCEGARILKSKRCDKYIEKLFNQMFDKKLKITFENGSEPCEINPVKMDSEIAVMYGCDIDLPMISMNDAMALSSSEAYRNGNKPESSQQNNDQNNKQNNSSNKSGKNFEAGKGSKSNDKKFFKVEKGTISEKTKSQCFDVILGKSINEAIVEISTVSLDSGIVCIKGDVVKYEEREIRGGDKFLVSFDLTDYTSSLTVKFFVKSEKMEDIRNAIKPDKTLLVRAEAQYDKYSREMSLLAKDICLSNREIRMDNAKKKRVELHVHTQMSSMDGVSTTKELIKRAALWGHQAIAITDHGVVQAYPDAMEAAKDNKIKVIYGVEAYLLDDAMPAVLIPGNMPLNGDFVVFDVETTGLNSINDRIIEIGAVKISNYEIVDRYSTFVNPEIILPVNITQLTGIENDMISDSPTIKEVLSDFQEFCKGSVLVAHNAEFDMGFIRSSAGRVEMKFINPVLDTLTLSRKLLSSLKRHKLDTVARHFGISLENHHRALHDAEATTKILLKFFDMLIEKGADNLSNIDLVISGQEDFTKMKTYHAILMVKDLVGLKNLYRIISESHLKYLYKKPRVPKKLLTQYREGLIVGSACEAGEVFSAFTARKSEEEIEKIARFYDFFEIQPLANNIFLIDNGTFMDINEIMEVNRSIVEIGKKQKKKVVATGDVHFLDPKDEVFRRILMAGQGFSDADQQAPLYLRTTDEMIEEFSYLGPELAYEVVVENTNAIADMVENILPIPNGTFPPAIEGAEVEIRKIAEEKARDIYGDILPEVVLQRLEKELNSIIKNGFSVMYIIAQKLVSKSVNDGYLVGSRGSVGSSLVANLIGITEVNSLPAHYVCEKCKFSEFITDGSISCGFDLPKKNCPKCDEVLKKDGYDIPFETFLGFDGDKEPDIDLNFSGEYQSTAHRYTEELFGTGHVYRAGTIGTIADKTAFGFVKGYMDEKRIITTNAEIGRLVKGCVGVKRTTGQHPGGVMIVPSDKEIFEFCPIQRPADDTTSSIITTHFDYHSISGRLLKLDILGHDDPTVIKMLEDLTGIDAKTIPIGDEYTMGIFRGTEPLGVRPDDINSEVGTFAIPEFGTKFVRQMLGDTRPTTFSELIRISGLSHGTDVWLNNAQELIRKRVATLSEVICTRDDIMLYLIYAGIPPKTAFKIMEDVRKGKGIKAEYNDVLKENKVPQWYADSCNRIKYMFPKAHAAAYVMMAFRIAWFKVHYPEAFYVAYYSVRADEFDAMIMAQSHDKLKKTIKEYEMRASELSQIDKNAVTQKDKNVLTIMEVVNEMYARGIKFLPVDLYESDPFNFKKGHQGIRLPLKALAGLGENAAASIAEARRNGRFLSIDDLRLRARISKTVIEILRESGALNGMTESSQLSMFEMHMM